MSFSHILHTCQDPIKDFVFRLFLLYLFIGVFVIPQEKELRASQGETEVKTGCVVNFGVPAAQKEGKDGQTKKEESNNHTYPVQPLQKSICWWSLRVKKNKKSVCA